MPWTTATNAMVHFGICSDLKGRAETVVKMLSDELDEKTQSDHPNRGGSVNKQGMVGPRTEQPARTRNPAIIAAQVTQQITHI